MSDSPPFHGAHPKRSFSIVQKSLKFLQHGEGQLSSLAVRGHLQPSLHVRMETTEIVHDPDPFQNRPALGASREIDVEAPVRGGRRMLEDVGIHPLDAVVHMQHLGRGSKRQLVDFDLVNPRLGSWRGRALTREQRTPALLPPGYSLEPS